MSERNRVIVFPIDGSEVSQRAIEWAQKNLLRDSDEVVLVTVRTHTTASPGWPENVLEAIKQHNQKEDEEAKQILHKLAAQLPGRKVDVQILHGEVRTELTKYIGVLKADLCVIGARGLSGIKRVMLGSTSEYLVNHVEIPVLIAH